MTNLLVCFFRNAVAVRYGTKIFGGWPNAYRADTEFCLRKAAQLAGCLFVQDVDVDADEFATKKAAAIIPIFGKGSVIEAEFWPAGHGRVLPARHDRHRQITVRHELRRDGAEGGRVGAEALHQERVAGPGSDNMVVSSAMIAWSEPAAGFGRERAIST